MESGWAASKSKRKARVGFPSAHARGRLICTPKCMRYKRTIRTQIFLMRTFGRPCKAHRKVTRNRPSAPTALPAIKSPSPAASAGELSTSQPMTLPETDPVRLVRENVHKKRPDHTDHKPQTFPNQVSCGVSAKALSAGLWSQLQRPLPFCHRASSPVPPARNCTGVTA